MSVKAISFDREKLLFTAIVAAAALTMPNAAFAASVGGSLQNVLDAVQELMTGPIARTVGIIAIAALGYAWLSGRMDAMRALVLCIGIGLIFGSTEIIDLISKA